ncbi:Protein LSD1 [Senna tora]|uniref:Protein LSD1 n=1 Tax=Senna tora TaxID=362788 RepID=A0A834W0B9_9FABA|nr:Protein LSD1 [Senna tora]
MFCHYITDVSVANGRLINPVHRPNGTASSGTVAPTLTSMPRSQSQTVVVENPMSVDASGKLVTNVVVGVTTEKK